MVNSKEYLCFPFGFIKNRGRAFGKIVDKSVCSKFGLTTILKHIVRNWTKNSSIASEVMP